MTSVDVADVAYVVICTAPDNRSSNVAAWQLRIDADAHVGQLRATNPHNAYTVDVVPVYHSLPKVTK